MKILLVANGNFYSTFGGGQVYVRNLADELVRKNMNVVILSFQKKDGFAQKNLYKNIPLYTLSSCNRESIKDLLTLIKPDVIHIHSEKSMMVSIANELNIPAVVTAHHGGIVCPAGALLNQHNKICRSTASHSTCLPCLLKNIKGGKIIYPILRLVPEQVFIRIGKILDRRPFLYFITPIGKTAFNIHKKELDWKIISQGANKVIAPSEAMAEAMERNGLSRAKISVLPHGIPLPDSSIFCNNQAALTSFFYAGRISYEKGLHILLAAFSDLKEKCELHIVGGADGKAARRYLGKLKKKYGNRQYIHWHGKVNVTEIPEKIAGWNVLIHPSICLDVYGLNIAEALAMGKPVIATKCGGAEMQVKPNINGLLVTPGNVQELRQAISYICKNPALRIQMGKNTRNGINNISTHVEELNSIFESTVL